MKILHRFVINKDSLSHEASTSALFSGVLIDDNSGFLSITIDESDERFYKISSIMKANHAVETAEARFSQKEINAAEWLYVRSKWQCAYPQPRNGLEYLNETFDASKNAGIKEGPIVCRCNLHQIRPFVIEKAPVWKEKCFAMLNWVYDELFVCDYARRRLEQSGLRGFGFNELLNPKGDKLDNISQIIIYDKVKKGVNNKSVEKVYFCDKCGEQKLLLKPGTILFDKQCFNTTDNDIIKTTDLFGEITGTPYILISHRFYDFIHNNGLEKNLVYVPVQLI